MIRLENLRKSFKGKPALEGISLNVRRGEIFGLLGHNGAGKSTSFGIMLGQVYPDEGEAFISGISVQRQRARALARVGAIFETPAFYDYLSGWRNLELLASYSGHVKRSELEEAVETVGLTSRIHDRVRTYSHGMRQRLALAQTLVPAPDLILLDEPTEGLDPEGIHEMRGLIQRLNRERGLTVLLSSHLLSEVEQLCDRIAILNRGRLVFEGHWAELAGSNVRYLLDLDNWILAAEIATGLGIVVHPAQHTVELRPEADVADLVVALVKAGVRIRGVEKLRPNLETIYLEAVTGAPNGKEFQVRDAASEDRIQL